MKRGQVGVFTVELFTLIHEVGLNRDLRLWKVEGFSPVVSLEHHFHERLEKQPYFAFKLPVGPEGCRFTIPDFSLVNTGFVLPQSRNTG